VGVEFVLHTLAVLGYMNYRCGNVTSAADDALVVQTAVGKEAFDIERIVLNAGEHAPASSSSLRT
jgi:ribosomal protein L1